MTKNMLGGMVDRILEKRLDRMSDNMFKRILKDMLKWMWKRILENWLKDMRNRVNCLCKIFFLKGFLTMESDMGIY